MEHSCIYVFANFKSQSGRDLVLEARELNLQMVGDLNRAQVSDDLASLFSWKGNLVHDGIG